VFPGVARPWIRDDARSPSPARSSPAPPQAAWPGQPPRGAGDTGQAGARAGIGDGPAAGRGMAGGPALPEGKVGRSGRGVPGGDRRPGPAGARPAGRAGLPPGTAGIHPPLRPSRQAGQRADGPGTRPEAPGRWMPVPAPPAGGGPARGPAAGRIPRNGHGGEHREGARRDGASARRLAARPGHAWLRAARDATRRICHSGLVPRASVLIAYLQKSGFEGPFSLDRGKRCRKDRSTRLCRDSTKMSVGSALLVHRVSGAAIELPT